MADTAAVCRLLRDGVAAVFGPTIAETSRHVASVCEAVEVPHFRAHWDLCEVTGTSVKSLEPLRSLRPL